MNMRSILLILLFNSTSCVNYWMDINSILYETKHLKNNFTWIIIIIWIEEFFQSQTSCVTHENNLKFFNLIPGQPFLGSVLANGLSNFEIEVMIFLTLKFVRIWVWE